MAGRHQIAPVLARPPFGWQMQFARLRNSRKITCLVCGSSGWNWRDDRPAPWQAVCLLGHPESCPDCGARFVKGGLYRHLFCRSGHPRCPEHIDTQHRRLQRMTA